MTLFNKLALTFIIAVTIYCIYLSVAFNRFKAKSAEQAKKALWAVEAKRDSLYRHRYEFYKDSMSAEYDTVMSELKVAHRNTQDAEKKSHSAHKKSIKADEERSLVHLHPDSLPRF